MAPAPVSNRAEATHHSACATWISRRAVRACPWAREEASRQDFLKQSLAALAVASGVAGPAAAAIVEEGAPVNFGRNVGSIMGKGKEKAGKIKTGNAGSLLKK